MILGLQDPPLTHVMMSNPRQKALGDFLRVRRMGLDPNTLGIADQRRRLTPGLRREEVALRAGIGVDWYVRLEQGRSVSPSSATIDALADALCLNAAEHAHLRALALANTIHSFMREELPPSLSRLVEGLHQPAYVTGRRWDLLAWNAAANDLFGFGDLPEPDRNILHFVLVDLRARALFGDAWADEARRMTAQFRVTHDLWASDPAFVDLLKQLQTGCAHFPAWWQAHEVRRGGSGRKVLHHSKRGPLAFEYTTFQANEDQNLKLAIYMPVVAATAQLPLKSGFAPRSRPCR